MKKLLLLLLIPLSGICQVSRTQVLYSNTDPSGSCPEAYLQFNWVSGNLWGCESGVWTIIASTGGGGSGTVTSVACNSSFSPNWLTCSFGGSATTTPILQLTPTGSLTANQVLATPNGSTGAVGLRALVAADIPSLSYLSLTGGTLTGALGISENTHALPSPQTGTLLQAGNVDGTATRIELDAFGAAPLFTGIRWDGTNASPTALVSGDQMGGYNAWGYNGTAAVGPQASLRTFAAQNWTSTALGTYVELATTPNNSTTLTGVARFENDGGITVPSTVTGGDKGTGTINAVGLYVNGTAVSTSGGTVTSVATSSPITGGPITSTGTIACATCVTSGASLTSTAIMTGAGSQGSQTPSATATLSSGGAISITGTMTDAGEIVTGTAATDSATLGSEVTTSGTCSGTGWTGTYPNYVAPATTAPLTCTGFTSGVLYQTVTGITNNAGVTGMTYGSGLSCSGTGTYPLTVTGGGGSGATGTITVTSGAVTGSIAVLTPGTAFTSTPTTGTLGTPTGSASCSGTLAMTSTIGGGTITVAIGTAQPGTSASTASSTFTFGPRANGTSLTYTPTAAFVGTIGISAKAITPISTYAFTAKDSTGSVSSASTQTLASLQNYFLGVGAGVNITTGINNQGVGYQALYFNTTGNSNAASGYQALYSNTTGNSNAANGIYALYSNTTGINNTASGYQALYSNTTGGGNTASGYRALYSNTTGSANTASGYRALYSNTNGGSNTVVGYSAGQYAGTGTTALTSISTSILIGNGAAAANATGDSNEILICGTGSVAANGTNTAAVGCPATTDLYAGSAGAALTHTAGIANGGTVYSVAGTPLPTCNSTNLLKRLPASDITTLGAAYVGSGTFTAWVECTYNSTGAVYAWYAM